MSENTPQKEQGIKAGQNAQISNSQSNTTPNMPPPPPPPPPIPGTFTLTIAPDYSEVFMELIPPKNGGKAVTENEFRRALAEKSVRYGLDDNLIRTIFDKNMIGTRHKIATFTPPENGTDGSVTYLFEMSQELKPKEDDKGFVDYRDLGIIRNIQAGQTIATIVLPTQGKPGTDVMGRPIHQKKGVAAKVSFGENVGLSGDGTILMALVAGNLKSPNGKFSVETAINIKGNVDLTTGNIDFIGDVNIQGEVMGGFKISSKKNIVINGNCTGAIIEAAGDVTIKKGALNSKINAKGNVKIDFAESSTIRCDGVLTGDIFLTSEVYCGELIATGKKGRLMGGKYTSLGNIQAGAIGSKSYAATYVTVGDNAVMQEEKADCEKKMAEKDMAITRCTQSIDFLHDKQRKGVHLDDSKIELLNTCLKSRIVFKRERSEILKRVVEIDEYLKNKQNLSIICKRHLYPGVKITLNDMVANINSVYQYCKVYMGEDGIKIDLL